MTDAATGKPVWSVPRNEGSSCSTPYVVTHQGQKQIVVTSTPKAMAYDFETGKLVWEVSGLGRNPIPMPIQSGDVVYVMTGFRDPKLMAVRLGRTGDLTGTDAVAVGIDARSLLHAVAGAARRHSLSAHRQRPAERAEREDRRAALPAAAPAEAVQLQGVSDCRQRAPVSGVRGRGRHRREDGAECTRCSRPTRWRISPSSRHRFRPGAICTCAAGRTCSGSRSSRLTHMRKLRSIRGSWQRAEAKSRSADFPSTALPSRRAVLRHGLAFAGACASLISSSACPHGSDQSGARRPVRRDGVRCHRPASQNATGAFQAAIDACTAAGGGTVRVPPGDYTVG